MTKEKIKSLIIKNFPDLSSANIEKYSDFYYNQYLEKNIYRQSLTENYNKTVEIIYEVIEGIDNLVKSIDNNILDKIKNNFVNNLSEKENKENDNSTPLKSIGESIIKMQNQNDRCTSEIVKIQGIQVGLIHCLLELVKSVEDDLHSFLSVIEMDNIISDTLIEQINKDKKTARNLNTVN
ncbi:MAG: hypothetical protein FJ216_08575 [Ignavibacteria bacterium]|nr:hypothetical protein [Ignavibacteria bacterium]